MTSTVDLLADRLVRQFNPAVIDAADVALPVFDEVGPQSVSHAPLFVEIEACLVRTRSAMWLVKEGFKQPLALFRCILELPKGRGPFKRKLADKIRYDVAQLPYNDSFLEWLWGERESDRQIWLISSADSHFAKRVADYLGLFDGVIASTPQKTIRGDQKLARIRAHVSGNGVFDYCGSAMADLNLFAGARNAVLVGASDEVQRHTTSQGNVSLVFD